MTYIIGIVFIAGIIIALMLENKKSAKEHYNKRINKLQRENDRLNYRHQQKENIISDASISLIQAEVKAKKDKLRAINFMDAKDEAFGYAIGLTDLVEYSIKKNGLNFAQNNFGLLVKIVDMAGRDVEGAYQIYRNIFNDLPDQLHFEPPSELPKNLNF